MSPIDTDIAASITVIRGPELIRSPALCAAAGVSYRQVDYWTRRGVFDALEGARHARGSGSLRGWPLEAVPLCRVLGRLSALGADTDLLAEVVAAIAADDTLLEAEVLVVEPAGPAVRPACLANLDALTAGGYVVSPRP